MLKFVTFILFSLIAIGFISFKSTLTLGVEQEATDLPLTVKGQIPEWLDGTLVRNSAIPVYINGQQAIHAFDGLAMLHGFYFNQGEVRYTNRFLLSKAYDTVVNQSSVQFSGFNSNDSDHDSHLSDEFVNNASVNVFKYSKHYVALTEIPLPACFNPYTLKTLGSFNFTDDLPKQHCWESAHPHFDPVSKEIVNYLIEFGEQSYYVIYRIKENSSMRETIAKIPVDEPSYMHSFALTERFCILTEFPLVVSPYDLMTSGKPFIQNFRWEPKKGTRLSVVDRNSGALVLQTIVDPIFSFHHVNAYDIHNEIVMDLIAYPDISGLSMIFPQASSSEKQSWKRRLLRYRIDIDQNLVHQEILLEKAVEFPRIDDEKDGKPYRYLYLSLSEGGIAKFDTETHQYHTWLIGKGEASEPIFVPSPDRKNEDEGIILTVIFSKEDHKSFLLVLNAVNLHEVARAEIPWRIPGSFHGQFFNLDIEDLKAGRQL